MCYVFQFTNYILKQFMTKFTMLILFFNLFAPNYTEKH